MREFDLTSYRKLADSLDIPVLAAETSDGVHWNAATWIDMAALDMVRTSSFYKGGLTGALKIAHLAEAHGMKAEVHGMGVANAHLGARDPQQRLLRATGVSRPSTSRGSESRTSCPSLTALSRRRRRLGWASMSIGPRSSRPRLPSSDTRHPRSGAVLGSPTPRLPSAAQLLCVRSVRQGNLHRAVRASSRFCRQRGPACRQSPIPRHSSG